MWIFFSQQGWELGKEKGSWFGAKKTLAWKKHYLVRLFWVPRSLYHHLSLIYFPCDYFCVVCEFALAWYCSFIQFFSVFVHGWSNCALIVCFMGNLLISRLYIYIYIHAFSWFNPPVFEPIKKKKKMKWVSVYYLVIRSSSVLF